MATFHALGTFKTVKKVLMSPLRTPLAKALFDVEINTHTTQDLPPDASSNAQSRVSRHDHHNIEVKTVSELGPSRRVVETDLYLFVPRSFEIRDFGKAELTKDFRSRMRLALPTGGSNHAEIAFETALRNACAKLAKLEAVERSETNPILDFGHSDCDELLEASKDLCSVIAEVLKAGSIEHAREFFMAHSLLGTPNSCFEAVDQLGERVTSIRDMIARVREATETEYVAASKVMALFDEYVSQLYVQYLGKLRSELSKIRSPGPRIDEIAYAQKRNRLEALLDRFQEEEAQHRARFSVAVGLEETELEREQRLLRLSHLKKFFQSNSFVDVSRQQSAKKIGESTAAAGTAMAGLVYALLEPFSRPGVTKFAVPSLALLTMWVVLYVLRDRMKDWMKAAFAEKALKFLPDYQQQLVAGSRKIGYVKEWFRFTTRKDLPKEIVSLRDSASSDPLESRLPEDVFVCRKVQEVYSTSSSSEGKGIPGVRALHEITRINLERYLKHMDDAFKELTSLDSAGRFSRAKSHRVYHFYICVRTKCREKGSDQAQESQLLYRIVLDKNGVVRLEELAS